MTTTVDIRPAAGRFHTDLGWLDSWHSFSFGHHYDPQNLGHGLLIVSNDDTVAPGGGFQAHPHRDMEIVTWVVDGRLTHRDSEGNEGVIRPGVAQRMSAGSGIVHEEMNASATEPVRFVQMWVPPDTAGVAPGYEQVDISERLASGKLVAVASGRGHDGAVSLHQRGAVLWAARPDAGVTLALPDAPFVHLFVVDGAIGLGKDRLGQGDAVRLSDAGALEMRVEVPSEVLVWETHARASR